MISTHSETRVDFFTLFFVAQFEPTLGSAQTILVNLASIEFREHLLKNPLLVTC
jgi:hypothetical protein